MYDYFMYIDSKSKNIINELRNYAWAKDKNDIQLETPIDDYNHGIDAIRYGETMFTHGGTIKML